MRIVRFPVGTADPTVGICRNDRLLLSRVVWGMMSAEFRGSYRPIAPVRHSEKGSLECFLTERYCLYRVDDSNHVQRLEIHHPRWPLQAVMTPRRKFAVTPPPMAISLSRPPLAGTMVIGDALLPCEASRMGAGARQWLIPERRLDVYVATYTRITPDDANAWLDRMERALVLI